LPRARTTGRGRPTSKGDGRDERETEGKGLRKEREGKGGKEM